MAVEYQIIIALLSGVACGSISTWFIMDGIRMLKDLNKSKR